MVRRGLGAVLVAVALVGCGADEPPGEGSDDTRGATGCPAGAVRLAFSTEAGEEGGDVMALGAGGEVTRLTDDGGSYGPAVAPDGSQVAFSSVGPDGTVSDTTGPEGLGIDVVAADGTDRRRLVDGGESHGPTWSPDGLRIAYAHQGSIEAPAEIWVVAADGSSDPEVLVPSGGGRRDSEPAWSPDGDRIAFVRDGVDLMVADADGTGAISVRHEPDGVSSISWAPDGTRLVVAVGEVTERGGRVGVVDVATGEVSIVSEAVRVPWWSASGRLYGFAVPPVIVDPTGGWRVSELELDEDGTAVASGRAVVEAPAIGYLYGDPGVSTPACDADAPALTDADDVPETLVVEHPVTGEETVVITRDQAEDLLDSVTDPDLGSDVEVTSRLVHVESPVPGFEEGLPELVWVVGAEVPPPDEVSVVFDAGSGAYLGGGPAPDQEPWASWPDLAPPP